MLSSPGGVRPDGKPTKPYAHEASANSCCGQSTSLVFAALPRTAVRTAQSWGNGGILMRSSATCPAVPKKMCGIRAGSSDCSFYRSVHLWPAVGHKAAALKQPPQALSISQEGSSQTLGSAEQDCNQKCAVLHLLRQIFGRRQPQSLLGSHQSIELLSTLVVTKHSVHHVHHILHIKFPRLLAKQSWATSEFVWASFSHLQCLRQALLSSVDPSDSQRV